MFPKVSVIVPVYKVEDYIEKCVRSLFSQTLDDIEYIFVDDCTPDRSMDVLKRVIEEYPNRVPGIKIIEHSENKGIAQARNTGMAAVTADYVIHCDSDDWVETDMYESMYNKAVSEDADIVYCDHWEESNSGSTLIKGSVCRNGREMMNRHKELLLFYGSLHNKLIKKSLYTLNNIRFTPGLNMGEDQALLIRIYFFAVNIVKVDKAFYHYNLTNADSITYSLNIDYFEQHAENIRRLEVFFKDQGAVSEFYDLMQFLKLSIKHLLLFSPDRKYAGLWRKNFPEANSHIWKYDMVSRKVRFIYWLAASGLTWLAIFFVSGYNRYKRFKVKS